jgi:dTDP-4-dehydrorhamnose reductase
VRILITGGAGQVGRELAEVCVAAGDEVTALDHRTLDVADRDAVLAAVSAVRPDTLVHAAAWTAVDACEADVERAMLVNGFGTRNVAEAAQANAVHLVYISTDYVFDGTKSEPYVETDEPSPESVYGRSKLAGERALRDLLGPDGATTARISWVCGRYGNNMVKTLLRLAADGVNPSFVTDQIGCPTIVEDVVPMLRRFAVDRRRGLFHVTNQGAVSWYEFARATFAAAGHDPDRVSPTTTAELQPARPAPRPANSVLENAALRAAGLPLLPEFSGSLERLVAQLNA